MKSENVNAKPLPQFEEETKEGMSFFSRDIVIINQDMVFSHLPEWKREQILNILMDYVDLIQKRELLLISSRFLY